MRIQEIIKNNPASFITSTSNNEWVKFNGLNVYLRKGNIVIGDEIKNTIQLANVTNPRRSTNTEINPNHRRTGKFSALIEELEKLAKKYDYDGIYVESILNDFLPEVLKRYVYSEVNINTGTTNYWKNIGIQNG